MPSASNDPLEAVSAATWSARSPWARQLLERMAIRQRQSARLLRAHRKYGEAAHAETAAARIELTLAEPEAVQRMRELTERFAEAPHSQALLERALEGAITLTGADLGNIQLADGHGALRIVAQTGFSDQFLEHFAAVDDESAACGRAAINRCQTVIPDVTVDPGFAPHRSVAAAAGFRAVQSTPLIDPRGRLRGVISTHFRYPRQPADRELQLIAWYGERLAAALPVPVTKPTKVYEMAAALHEQAAELQQRSASLMWAGGLGTNVPPGAQLERWASTARERAALARDRAEARRSHIS